MQVEFIKGEAFTDERGTLNCVNLFDFGGIKRFYHIKHHDTSVVRAWQGHKVEHKYFYAAEGSFVVAWVRIDDFKNPSPALQAERMTLSAEEPGVLCIPAGYANGIKAITPNAIISVYSNVTLEESRQDIFRFDRNLWMDWNVSHWY